MGRAALILAFLVLNLQFSTAFAADNLLANGDFEAAARKDGVPTAWTTYVPDGTAALRVDPAGAHDGRQGVLIETPTDLKASLVSDPIPVAPGEKLSLSVWCRTENVKSSVAGTLTFNAGFLDRNKHYFRWHKAQPQAPRPGGWMHLITDAEVPPGAAYVTFQLGHARITGRTRWDGAELRAESPLAVRLDLAAAKLEPGKQSVPAVIINRKAAQAGQTITVVAQPGNIRTQYDLTKQAEQRIFVPIAISKRGKNKLKLTVAGGSGRTMAEASADVTVPPLLVIEPLAPTHWCVEDGEPRPDGRLWVHEEAEKRGRLALRCTLLKGDAVAAEWKSDSLPANPIAFTLAPPKTDLDDYTVEYTLSRDGETVATEKRDWHIIHRSDARVTLNANGYPVVGGKAIFPLGIFNGGRFAEQAAAGFTVTHNYNAAATVPGQVPDNAKLKEWLDTTQAAGMKALVLLTHGSHARTIDDEVVRRVRMFRNHPALLAWDEEEGVARGEAPLTLPRDVRAVTGREDPNHPLMLGDSRDVIYKLKDRSDMFPADCMDMGMWWWYPFPLNATARPVLLEGEEVAASGELVPPSFLVQAKTSKPLWVGIQAYRKPERTDGRFPTPTEYRAQAYLGVIHGAKGLMYYVGSGSGGNGILNKPEEGNWDYVKKLATELQSMADTFMAPDAEGTVTVEPATALISTRLKNAGNKRILLTASRSAKAANVTLRVSGGSEGSAPVRFENRTVPVKSGQLADDFKPYDVHVYELP